MPSPRISVRGRCWPWGPARQRFRPRTERGTAPAHWLLGPAGAAVLAAEAGTDLPDLHWSPDTTIALSRSHKLGHTVGVNGFYTALIRAARDNPDRQLRWWWTAARCATEWGEVVRLDGYGV